MKMSSKRSENSDLLLQSRSVEIEKYLKTKLERKRYKHVLSVRDTALELAHVYGADLEKTDLAALLHDCAKWMTISQQYEAVAAYDLELDEFEQRNTALLHANVGAALAVDFFAVTDEEVLCAVRSHTKGNQSMTLLDKILYVADFAEPRRVHKNADRVREIAGRNLDKAVFEVARSKITRLIDKGAVVHPDTIAVYNSAHRTIN